MRDNLDHEHGWVVTQPSPERTSFQQLLLSIQSGVQAIKDGRIGALESFNSPVAGAGHSLSGHDTMLDLGPASASLHAVVGRVDLVLDRLGMLKQLPEGSGDVPRWERPADDRWRDDADDEPRGRPGPGIRNRTIVDATATQLEAERFPTPKLDELLQLLRELTTQTDGAAQMAQPIADAMAAQAAQPEPDPEPAPSPVPEVERVSSSIVNVLQEELERSTEALLAAANALRGIDDEGTSDGD